MGVGEAVTVGAGAGGSAVGVGCWSSHSCAMSAPVATRVPSSGMESRPTAASESSGRIEMAAPAKITTAAMAASPAAGGLILKGLLGVRVMCRREVPGPGGTPDCG